MRETNKRIIAKRKKSGITQIEMAKRLGLKFSTYSQMERSGKIYDEMLVKIADILNVDVRCFLYDEEFITESHQPQLEIEPIREEVDPFYDDEERYLILTYRNLREDEKKAAYSLFMEHFNFNVILQKRRAKKKEKRELNNKP